jgi:hypothetical protein
MYKHYYVNKDTSSNPNHNHEVHTEDCTWMPSLANREYLGYFDNCTDAVQAAKGKKYSNVDGCKTCCPLCHKG